MFLPFFCLANIYRPSLGKMRLGRPNQNQSISLKFYLRKKKNILLRIVCTTMFRYLNFNFDFHLFLKIYFKNVSKNHLSKCLIIYIIIINKIVFWKSDGDALLWSFCWCQLNLFHQIAMDNEWIRLFWNFKNSNFGKMQLNIFTMKIN